MNSAGLPMPFVELVLENIRTAGEEARELAEEFGLNRRQPSEPSPEKQTFKTGVCSGCGKSLEDLTRGCVQCRSRHNYRVRMKYSGWQRSAELLADPALKLKGGRPPVRTEMPGTERPRINGQACSGCGGPLDGLTPGCIKCRNRLYNRHSRERIRRRIAERRTSAASVSE